MKPVNCDTELFRHAISQTRETLSKIGGYGRRVFDTSLKLMGKICPQKKK